jgi:hypothetical protein
MSGAMHDLGGVATTENALDYFAERSKSARMVTLNDM